MICPECNADGIKPYKKILGLFELTIKCQSCNSYLSFSKFWKFVSYMFVCAVLFFVAMSATMGSVWIVYMCALAGVVICCLASMLVPLSLSQDENYAKQLRKKLRNASQEKT